MNGIELAKAKEYFALGLLTGFKLHRVPMRRNSWVIEFRMKEQQNVFLELRRGDQRVFANLQTAVNMCEIIGFDVSALALA